MEDDIRIQDNLYQAVNGEWLKTAVIPADRPTAGGFTEIDRETEKIMMADFAAFAKNEKSSDIAGMEDAVKLYKKVLDIDKRNAEGIKPLLPLLKEIEDLKDVADLNSKAKDFLYKGLRLPIRMGVEADMKDATTNCFYVLGPSIILPDTPYYDNDAGKQLLKVYEDMALKALAFTDLPEDKQKEYIADTLAYDKLISKKVKSQLEWADYVKNYNPMPLEEVASCVTPFDIKGFLKEMYGDRAPETLIVYDPKAVKEMSSYFNEENFELYKHWLYVSTLLSNANLLSADLYEISTIYRRTLLGIAENPTLEKQAYQVASYCFSEPVGIYYGRTYFGEEAKKDIISLVEKVIATYIKRMKENTFLSKDTCEKAILKLSTMAVKMGYPDDVREFFKKLKVDEDASYFDNARNLSLEKIKEEFSKFLKPVDRNEWYMPGHMVNACYDPSRNDITFPAAILQKPFYSLKQSFAENLGGIGAVIGHEISHAFDNNGAHFDEKGNLSDWWTKEDFEAFDRLTKDMIRQWDGIEYHGGKVNGELVVSENIADNGGMAVTLDIMHQSNEDFDKYFINRARIWCLKSREEYIQLLLNNDVHSPAELRANIQVRNFPEWYAAFDVKEGDEMYIAPDKRIIIW